MNSRTATPTQAPPRNRTTAPSPPDSLHTFVERSAALTPTAIAVVCGDQRLSYAELDARANQLARHLRDQGVSGHTAVAIWLPRGVDQIVAMVAVWKAGGYYVAIDDDHPAERIAMMLADAAPPVVLTRGADRIAASERTGGAKVVCLDRDAAELADRQATAPGQCAVSQDALAALIYTSGSTGRPKAVALTHGNVVSAQICRDAYRVPPERLLLPVSFAFDVFLTFSVWTLRAGGRLVIPAATGGIDLDELAALLREERITHVVSIADTQRALLARDDARQARWLRLAVVGGQSCPLAMVEQYGRLLPGVRVVNEYALTETSAGTYFVVDPAGPSDPAEPDGADSGERERRSRSLPIGQAATNYRVHLLDERLAPVPAGQPAQLYIGGPGIARGYHGRPEVTAERFVPDPFAGDGGRLYRTGDLARSRPDGVIEFLGRGDHQVEVRGFRVELAEVEAALVDHDAVATAAVCFLPGRRELTAFVVAAGDAAPAADALREYLRGRLPEPMVPQRFVPLPELPLTPNGKVNRTALTERAESGELDAMDGGHRAVTAPRTADEAAVCELWAEVLDRDGAELDVHASFFELGGHSLHAATMVAALRSRFALPLGMADLFAGPTVAGLAARIGTLRDSDTQDSEGQR